jgi:hypothetical protein
MSWWPHAKKEVETPSTPPDERGLAFAWQTHAAISDWTSKVDTKSSIVLSLGGAVLGFCITLTADGRLLDGLHGWSDRFVTAGLGTLALGVLVAAFAVFPRLKRRQARKNWTSNYVYFGHLRHWNPADLKAALLRQSIDEQLDVLATQLVTSSKISWNKHVTLQLAMVLLTIGSGLIGAAAVWPK